MNMNILYKVPEGMRKSVQYYFNLAYTKKTLDPLLARLYINGMLDTLQTLELITTEEQDKLAAYYSAWFSL